MTTETRERKKSLPEILQDLEDTNQTSEKAITAEELFNTLDPDEEGKVKVDDFLNEWKRTPSKEDFEKWIGGGNRKPKYNSDTMTSKDFENWRENERGSGPTDRGSGGTRSRAASDDFSVEELREKFENYDSNGNGHLTQSEFINLFSSYTGSELSSEQASQLYKELGKNDGDTIDFEDLLQLFQDYKSQPGKFERNSNEDALSEKNLDRLSAGSDYEGLGVNIRTERLQSSAVDEHVAKERAIEDLATTLEHKDRANRNKIMILQGQLDKLEEENKTLLSERNRQKQKIEKLESENIKLTKDLDVHREKAADLISKAEREEKKRTDLEQQMLDVNTDNEGLRNSLRKMSVSLNSPTSNRSRRRRNTKAEADLSQFPEIRRELEMAANICSTLRAENEQLRQKARDMKFKYEETFTHQLQEINSLSAALGRRRSGDDLRNDMGGSISMGSGIGSERTRGSALKNKPEEKENLKINRSRYSDSGDPLQVKLGKRRLLQNYQDEPGCCWVCCYNIFGGCFPCCFHR
mmetsp:Transcript_361/g.531  ORF Transcript_361/g.531 Transcript_361/m.531 type:complete len:524 (-) Transcript_361:156-1727(-)